MTKSRTQQAADDRIEQLARNVYDNVRQLNHATARPPGLTYPGTAYSVLGNLSEAVYGLGQTLEQLDRFLTDELNAGRLGHDLGHSPVTEIHEAQDELRSASTTARKVANTLGRAQSAISAVNAKPQLTPARVASQAFPMPPSEAIVKTSSAGTRPNHPPQARPGRAHGRGEA
ncbi:hypothetical protein [Actinocorallia sp. A-T 12471]|uniref:hypothetical protein n=1 Tax=Actinocorallia sp. A-T 12471 TaxID=3089813 RepID=UPI0029D0F649|nr:hypothetical protein [Actinocorallia sp. A-T 12471]MDX6738695.1 hypothetical protein [Actinocorallia sp. A-T 12471]